MGETARGSKGYNVSEVHAVDGVSGACFKPRGLTAEFKGEGDYGLESARYMFKIKLPSSSYAIFGGVFDIIS